MCGCQKKDIMELPLIVQLRSFGLEDGAVEEKGTDISINEGSELGMEFSAKLNNFLSSQKD